MRTQILKAGRDGKREQRANERLSMPASCLLGLMTLFFQGRDVIRDNSSTLALHKHAYNNARPGIKYKIIIYIKFRKGKSPYCTDEL